MVGHGSLRYGVSSVSPLRSWPPLVTPLSHLTLADPLTPLHLDDRPDSVGPGRPRAVLQVIDSLDAGGAERMAVTIANALVGEVEMHVCTTRHPGALRAELDPRVGVLGLRRSRSVDPAAARALRRYVEDHRVDVVHAHSSSLFLLASAYAAGPRPPVVWHDHLGQVEERRRLPYLVARRWFDVAVAVSRPIERWHAERLRLPPTRRRFVHNFVTRPPGPPPRAADLPGASGTRVVAVANLRPEKDQLSLLAAFAQVRATHPDAHLLLVGGGADTDYGRLVCDEIDRLGLGVHVSLLGVRSDVAAVLAGVDIAVLSSVSEGSPVVVQEYALAGLPVVATRVGEVPELLDRGRAGILAEVHDVGALADGLAWLLEHPGERTRLGDALAAHVAARYPPEASLADLRAAYAQAMARRARISRRRGPSSRD